MRAIDPHFATDQAVNVPRNLSTDHVAQRGLGNGHTDRDHSRPMIEDVSVHPSAAGAAAVWIDPPSYGGDPIGRRFSPSPAAVSTASPTLASSVGERKSFATTEMGSLADSAMQASLWPESLLVMPENSYCPTVEPTRGAERPGTAVAHAPAPAAEAPAPAKSTFSQFISPAATSSSAIPPASTAVWEVDAFAFPNTIHRFIADPGLMRSVGRPLDQVLEMGLSGLLITSDRPGVGRTCVATCLAVAAARAGLRVVLVDATVPGQGSKSATLTESLQLDISHGWLDAIRGGVSIAETAIRSIEDQLTLLPWVTPSRAESVTRSEISGLLSVLRKGFDLIVIDGPSTQSDVWEVFASGNPAGGGSTPSDHPARGQRGAIDAAVVVRDAREGTMSNAIALLEAIRQRGLLPLGVVENFV
jgi:Mrp family chromosome partitioning ATPase